MAEDIISKLIELDSRAEEVLAKARREAKSIGSETAKKLEQAKAELQERTKRGTAEVEAREAEERKAKIAEIDAQFEKEAQAIRRTGGAATKRAVEKVVTKAKGSPA